MKCIRFVAGTNWDSPRQQHGVVTELRMLRDSEEADACEVDRINELFKWLNDSLPCPPFVTSGWSPDAISWFKDSAQTQISQFRDLIATLEIHGHPVRTITTSHPGRILYEDEFQIVAESHRY